MACRTGVRWLYKLDANYVWDSRHEIPESLVFFDANGNVRLIIEESGRITVTRGYAWNGCSPKFCIFDLMMGTPEGVVHRDSGLPKTYHASLVHDSMYQFLSDGLPLRRRDADAFFRRLLKEWDFSPAWLYWLAVRLFGGIVRVGTKRKRQWRGTGESVADLLASAPV